jgi:hypothetical protein
MAVRFAVFTILSIAACFWAINIARDTKKWRLHWLDFLTVLDIDTHREQRRVQEGHLGIVAWMLFVIFAASAISCAFWTIDQIGEAQRMKTAPERDSEYLRRQIEEVAKIPRRR